METPYSPGLPSGCRRAGSENTGSARGARGIEFPPGHYQDNEGPVLAQQLAGALPGSSTQDRTGRAPLPGAKPALSQVPRGQQGGSGPAGGCVYQKGKSPSSPRCRRGAGVWSGQKEPRSVGGSGPRWLPAHVQPGTPTPTLCSPWVGGRRPSCSRGRLWERSAWAARPHSLCPLSGGPSLNQHPRSALCCAPDPGSLGGSARQLGDILVHCHPFGTRPGAGDPPGDTSPRSKTGTKWTYGVDSCIYTRPELHPETNQAAPSVSLMKTTRLGCSRQIATKGPE
ncbi:collagen alpha-1(I) chain-like [Rhinolophus ferrumequinum]|uniref:collagen alpha-1(I) chain-like n=1 Tax=Rhinolophus ferrumequinum TaxID=59479 RepID=UPI00140F6C42|nr:collagen alpha-1(I) chain-like [Rhinolophus ferrumequinum]